MQSPQRHSLSHTHTPPFTLVSPDWRRGYAGCDTSWSSAQTKKPAECAVASKRISVRALLILHATNVSGSCLCFNVYKGFPFFPYGTSSTPWKQPHKSLQIHVISWIGATLPSARLPKQGRIERSEKRLKEREAERPSFICPQKLIWLLKFSSVLQK